MKNIPFYFVAGNHDWIGNVTAQIEYSNLDLGDNRYHRWNFPNYYYSKQFTVPMSNDHDDNYDNDYNINSSYTSTLEIIMIDTVILCDHGSESQQTQDAWLWIKDTLTASIADYVIVAGHYPIWSVGHHGPKQCLVDKLRPLLLKHGVQLYMNGHDHTMEYIEEEFHSAIGYVTTGAGHRCNRTDIKSSQIPEKSLIYHDCHYNKGGFARVGVDSNGMSVHYYLGDSNEVTFSTRMFPPRSDAHTQRT